jgi:hypothetical protein
MSWLRDRLRPTPSDPPWRYPEELPANVEALLTTTDDEVVKEILSEAESLFGEPDGRAESAERRATTLQGAVTIASSVILTGGGLVIDPGKITDDTWRLVFAIAFSVLLAFLVATGLRAMGATSRILEGRAPADDTLRDRAQFAGATDYRRHRAAYLLWAYGRNDEVAAVKVEYLKKAAFWFRSALVMLVVVMGLLVGYVIDHEPPPKAPPANAAGR